MTDLDRVASPREPQEWSTALPADRHASALARRDLRKVLAVWDLRCLVDDAELITSELVNNVIQHGAFPAELRVQWTGACVRVAVEDAHPGAPHPRQAPPDALDGRGLRIIGACAQDWGVDRTDGGKVVWADLPLH